MKDRCHQSISTLEIRVSEFFQKNNSESSLWFADDPKNESWLNPKAEITEVIFFGSFFFKMQESLTWPFQKVRFWCLSSAVKKTLVSFYGLKEENVGQIFREELFPKALYLRSFPSFDEECTLVFSGRLSPTKNIETFLAVGSYLQKKIKKLKVVCQGEFSNDRDLLVSRPEGEDYKAFIEKLVSKLEWQSPPVFLPSQKETFWTEDHKSNPIFASFSLFRSEDFGVSVSEARASGWPAIVSDWGGHQDLSGESLIKVPAYSIPEAWENFELFVAKCESLAEFIISKWRESDLTPTLKNFFPQVVSLKELTFKNLEKLNEENIQDYLKTAQGLRLGARYKKYFSASLKNKAIVMVLADFKEDETEDYKLIPTLIKSYGHYALESQFELHYISLRELMATLPLYQENEIAELVFPFVTKSLIPLIQTLTQNQNVAFPLSLFYPEKNHSLAPALQHIFRPQDNYGPITPSSLFKNPKADFASVVEIELNSDCNQLCSYCPNSLTQGRPKKEMSEETFAKLLQQLKEIHFEGILSFHFYNEPLLNMKLEEKMKMASKVLTKAKIFIYTNGSLLSLERFRSLIDAHVFRVIVTKHEKISLLPLENELGLLSKDEKEKLIVQDHQSLKKTNRGGSLSSTERLMAYPCFIPSSMLVVTAEGNVLPCYEDYYEKMILGNITKNSLKEIWNNENYQSLRESLRRGERKRFLPCSKCDSTYMMPIL